MLTRITGDTSAPSTPSVDLKPGVLAQNVGMPDPVIYRSRVATVWGKYHDQIAGIDQPDILPDLLRNERDAMQALLDRDTDPLTLTIEACRKRGVPIVASYRMNAEDFYEGTTWMADFGRDRPRWKIPNAHCLDPAVPEVFEHRMRIFREVAERHDIDGIEFDFRRWYHMVSRPLENHPVLTRMVRETRRMLDGMAQKKGRSRLLLGARVGPSLEGEPNPFLYPGIDLPQKPQNASCRELGLDVRTWVTEGLVDYLCPSLFLGTLPGMPLTREFAALAKGTAAGIYPTLWPLAAWMHGVCEKAVGEEGPDFRALGLYRYDLCTTALRMYADGADGISTFNWYCHLKATSLPYQWLSSAQGLAGAGAESVQAFVLPILKDPAALRRYREAPSPFPPHAGV